MKTYWLYGTHSVCAALNHSGRHKIRLFVTQERVAEFKDFDLKPQVVSRASLEAVLPHGAVHQGVALEVDPLPALSLKSFHTTLHDQERACVVALDQVTDPHNVGAVLRSCAAFGVDMLLTQEKHSPFESGVLAKAAAGGLELVPWVRDVNLARALDVLKKNGFWVIGFDGAAQHSLHQFQFASKTVLVFGAEGQGLRPLVRQACDACVKIEHSDALDSLNVSNAAAIALYQCSLTKL